MSKKIFCDICGTEMSYVDIPEYLRAESETIKIEGTQRTINFDIAVRMIPTAPRSGEHIDCCYYCRIKGLTILQQKYQRIV